MWQHVGNLNGSVVSGGWFLNTGTVPYATFPPTTARESLINQQLIHWRAIAEQENFIANVSPEHFCIIPFTGLSKGGKTTGVEAAYQKRYGTRKDIYPEGVEPVVHILKFDTERGRRKGETKGIHRHRHRHKGTIAQWILDDEKRPIGKKKLFLAARYALNWYAVTRKEIELAFQPAYDDKGNQVPKIVVFPSFPEFTAIFKMMFPGLVHSLCMSTAEALQGKEFPTREARSDAEEAWRVHHSERMIELFHEQCLNDESTGVSWLDSLCVPVALDYKELDIPGLRKQKAVEAYKLLLGLEAATLIMTTAYNMTSRTVGQHFYNQPYIGENRLNIIGEAFQHIPDHRHRLTRLYQQNERLIQELIREQAPLPATFDVARQIQAALDIPGYDLIYPGRRELPATL